jgi:hypothetical protein
MVSAGMTDLSCKSEDAAGPADADVAAKIDAMASGANVLSMETSPLYAAPREATQCGGGNVAGVMHAAGFVAEANHRKAATSALN